MPGTLLEVVIRYLVTSPSLWLPAVVFNANLGHNDFTGREIYLSKGTDAIPRTLWFHWTAVIDSTVDRLYRTGNTPPPVNRPCIRGHWYPGTVAIRTSLWFHWTEVTDSTLKSAVSFPSQFKLPAKYSKAGHLVESRCLYLTGNVPPPVNRPCIRRHGYPGELDSAHQGDIFRTFNLPNAPAGEFMGREKILKFQTLHKEDLSTTPLRPPAVVFSDSPGNEPSMRLMTREERMAVGLP
ncbi:hypothetical protein DFH07DRAFT_773806 [Mycena maculata]|uniref:Uncharacterized protein n=1 Tax=Mycena maculata TaxID=230809 RepID=A0AAD7NBU0_9AGAR|nr:hypothetical protein DFH07DRAFT_773806 [Mycena maculata]